mmetsp:Transcript_10256/g.28645  ORF Transcript_10256/g.28645 Transcript_10256/m.28645 type:complete len:211 (+) Transcript_10256:49-681(+)
MQTVCTLCPPQQERLSLSCPRMARDAHLRNSAACSGGLRCWPGSRLALDLSCMVWGCCLVPPSQISTSVRHVLQRNRRRSTARDQHRRARCAQTLPGVGCGRRMQTWTCALTPCSSLSRSVPAPGWSAAAPPPAWGHRTPTWAHWCPAPEAHTPQVLDSQAAGGPRVLLARAAFLLACLCCRRAAAGTSSFPVSSRCSALGRASRADWTC